MLIKVEVLQEGSERFGKLSGVKCTDCGLHDPVKDVAEVPVLQLGLPIFPFHLNWYHSDICHLYSI